MRSRTIFITILLSLIVVPVNQAQQNDSIQNGSYFGQKPPEKNSENFDDTIDLETLKKAKELAERIIIIDCHSHNLFQSGSLEKPKQVSLSMLKGSGVNGIVQSFPLDFGAIKNPSEDILKNIMDTKNKIKEESLNISVVLESNDFISVKNNDSVNIMLGIEYFRGIFGGNIEMLEEYYKEGVREIGIVRTGGLDHLYVNDDLTEFGLELISEMNRLGIICDITHLTESAQLEVIEASQAPVILSHTNAHSVVNSGFNATDSTLEKLTAKGGIICVTFFSGQLSRKAFNHLKEKKDLNQLPKASIEELMHQIDYLKKKVGIDFIGIGSDYGGSGRMGPEGLETIEGFPMIIYHLLKRNYSEKEIEKVMGLNFIRFYKRVENKAEMQKFDISRQQNDYPLLKGPYLGQKLPGMTPEIFAPGIISTEASEASSGFAHGGTVFIFQKFIDQKCHTYFMRSEDNEWSKPELIPFWEQLIHNGDFVISPDDQTMFYQVKQEVSGRLDSNIWQVKLKGEGWGPRFALPSPINTPYDESFASQAADGNLYFFSRRPGGAGQSDLYLSEYKNGVHMEPVNLDALNTPYHEWDPFIAPDESYLIFCSTKPGGMGMDDLYISFRNHQNQWDEPIHLDSRFNSPKSENRPYVTHDGKYFFFTSTRSGNRDIYWVNAEIFKELNTDKIK